MITVQRWLQRKWMQFMHPELVKSYHATFASVDGQRVLQHLLDNIYCTVYEGLDPNAALVHNARRSVVQEILLNIDVAEHADKYYAPTTEQESLNGT